MLRWNNDLLKSQPTLHSDNFDRKLVQTNPNPKRFAVSNRPYRYPLTARMRCHSDQSEQAEINMLDIHFLVNSVEGLKWWIPAHPRSWISKIEQSTTLRISETLKEHQGLKVFCGSFSRKFRQFGSTISKGYSLWLNPLMETLTWAQQKQNNIPLVQLRCCLSDCSWSQRLRTQLGPVHSSLLY